MEKIMTLCMVNGDEYTFKGDAAVAAYDTLSRCFTYEWGNATLIFDGWSIKVFDKHIVSINTKGIE